MSAMIPFRYSGFWDVPRHILLRYRDTWLFLYSAFDDDLDDYSETYAVYRLPPSIEPRLETESWGFVFEMTDDCIGTIKVKDVRFDDTKRASLEPSCLEELDQFREV
jgi:hypothetical protein